MPLYCIPIRPIALSIDTVPPSYLRPCGGGRDSDLVKAHSKRPQMNILIVFKIISIINYKESVLSAEDEL